MAFCQANVDADGSTGDLSVPLAIAGIASAASRGKGSNAFDAYCLMVLILIYFPCVAVHHRAIKKNHMQSGQYLQWSYNTIAWAGDVLVHQFGSLLL